MTRDRVMLSAMKASTWVSSPFFHRIVLYVLERIFITVGLGDVGTAPDLHLAPGLCARSFR